MRFTRTDVARCYLLTDIRLNNPRFIALTLEPRIGGQGFGVVKPDRKGIMTMARLAKKQALDHWNRLEDNQTLNPDSIPYKHAGTTYGADGIRVEGSREFVDAVLSHLKGFLAYENGSTRLSLNYQQVEAREGKQNDFAGNWVCYCKVHTRGSEAQMINAAFGRNGRIPSAGY